MTDENPDSEPVLGRNLVETARLNSPEQHAGRNAAQTVKTAAGDQTRRTRHRRRFRALMVLLIVLFVVGGWLAAAHLTGSR